MTIGLIPARSGSKGVPKKNINLLAGYPLIAYSIIASILSSNIERTIVSTDSPEFAEIALFYGAEVPFLRPKEISGDKSLDIEAACGGCCACATCHVYISEEWFQKLSPIDDDEESMLDQAFDVKKTSRLSCQINLTDDLDGLKLELAPD